MGQISRDLTNHLGGRLNIGTAGIPGTLTITGHFIQDARSVLNVQIGGTGLDQFDHLVVGVAATLNGTLNVSLVNNFRPDPAGEGDIFQFLTAGEIQGTFSTTNGLNLGGGVFFQIFYGPFAVTLLTKGP